jgi:hypothetical protein
MKIQTKYNYEKIWTLTAEKDILKIIEEEVGDADVQGVLAYIQETIKTGKELSVGSCKFRINKKG